MNKTIPIPSREQVTNLQVSTLLSSLATLLPFYRKSSAWNADDDSARVDRVDGGAQMAMELSIVNICDRLDSIVTDQSRWSMAATNELERHLAMLYTEHAKTLKLQQQQLYHMARPSSRHGPAMLRLKDGSWLAILGRIEDINNAVVGVGGSPEQALEAFDEMFEGKIPSHLEAWMAMREEAIQNNLQPPTKEQYDKKTLDQSRRGGPKTNEGGGSQPGHDGGGAEPDEEGSGDQAGPPPQDRPGPYRFDGPSSAGI